MGLSPAIRTIMVSIIHAFVLCAKQRSLLSQAAALCHFAVFQLFHPVSLSLTSESAVKASRFVDNFFTLLRGF